MSKERVAYVAGCAGMPCQPIAATALVEIERLERENAALRYAARCLIEELDGETSILPTYVIERRESLRAALETKEGT